MLNHGQRALRIGLPAIDLKTRVCLQEVKGMVKKHRPRVLWISLPCGPPQSKSCSMRTLQRRKRTSCVQADPQWDRSGSTATSAWRRSWVGMAKE